MKPSYAQKLKDPRWQKVRLRVMEAQSWTCQCCDSEEDTLHVHHGLYEKGKEPWEANPQTLWTVCENCHELVGDLQAACHREVGFTKPSKLSGLILAIRFMRDNGFDGNFLEWACFMEWAIENDILMRYAASHK